MNDKGLTITIGVPGAGKSTWADKNLPDYCLRLERDRFREALFGSRRAYHDCTVVDRDEKSDLVTNCMLVAMQGWSPQRWALTDTGLEHRSVAPYIEVAHEYGLPIDLVVVERSPAYLRSANRIRELAHRIPEDILEERIAMFFDEAAWWRHAPYQTRRVT